MSLRCLACFLFFPALSLFFQFGNLVIAVKKIKKKLESGWWRICWCSLWQMCSTIKVEILICVVITQLTTIHEGVCRCKCRMTFQTAQTRPSGEYVVQPHFRRTGILCAIHFLSPFWLNISLTPAFRQTLAHILISILASATWSHKIVILTSSTAVFFFFFFHWSRSC